VSLQSDTRCPAKSRRRALRIFYVFVLLDIAIFCFAFSAHRLVQNALIGLGIIATTGAVWSFLRFLRAADDLQRAINSQATSFAFVSSVILSLVVGLLQRYGFLSGASLLLPAVMVALWSIGLIIFSWRYQ
jgi:hypothetical protein